MRAFSLLLPAMMAYFASTVAVPAPNPNAVVIVYADAAHDMILEATRSSSFK